MSKQRIAQSPKAYTHCSTESLSHRLSLVHDEASHFHGDRLMNTRQHAIYTLNPAKLHPHGPIKPASLSAESASSSSEDTSASDATGLSPMLSASGKAVLRTHKALVRKTTRLYHRVQRDLSTEALSFVLKNRAFDPAGSVMSNESAPHTPVVDDLTYVPGWSAKAVLPDGTGFILRPLLEEDRDRLEEGFERLSHESRYQRFMTSMEVLPEHYLRYLTDLDYRDHFAVVAAIEDPVRFDLQGLGIARFIALDCTPNEAELAITIADEAQGRGLGKILMDVLLRAASERGLSALRAEVLPDNTGMRTLAERFGGEKIAAQEGLVTWRIPVPAADELPDATYLLED